MVAQSGAIESGDATATSAASPAAHVVFLSANDIYKLLPDDQGQGGVAEFATLLSRVRAELPPDAHVIVTVNGDFLWRTDLDPPFKAEMMIAVLRALEIDYVVLGNHEFDFGAQRCLELLPTMPFTVLGSNARLRESRGLLPGVTDFEIVSLAPSGLKLGLFGVLTSNPHEFVVSHDPLVEFEREVAHATRCVRALKSAGADVIVALTHTRLAIDRLLARQVPGIHLILGGHDHEPVTMFEKTTLIHKSGCDGLWLGHIDLFVGKEHDAFDGAAHVDVQFGWRMVPNRGYQQDPAVKKLLEEYSARVANESNDPAMDMTLAVSRTRLDGTRLSLRTQESNLGNIVADAVRVVMEADVVYINGGFIQCERSYRAGRHLTSNLLREMLPILNVARCVRIKALHVRRALSFFLSRYPDESSMMPHVSGVFLVYTASPEARELRMFYDREHQREIPDDTIVRFACSRFIFDEAEGRELLTDCELVCEGKATIRDMVAAFLAAQPNGEIAYAAQEGRLTFREA